MLAEFLDRLKFLTSQAEAPKRAEYGDPRTVLISANGQLQEKDVPPPLRDHQIFQIDDFIEAANRWGIDDGETAQGVIFHSPEAIVLVTDDADRRDIVTMALTESETFKFLRVVHASQLDHKKLIQILKTTLRGKVIDSLLPMIRKLEVASGSRQTADVQHGRERGTREFQAELANATELPEIVDVMTSVYSNYGLRTAQRIPCTLDVELPQLLFRLAPLPDVINEAVEVVQAQIHELLVNGVAEGIQVFHGEP